MASCYEFFSREDEHEMWPPINPEDQPFSVFTCKLCGWKKRLQTCGTYFEGEDPFYKRVEKILSWHLIDEHVEKPKTAFV